MTQVNAQRWLDTRQVIGLCLLASLTFYLAFAVPTLGFLIALTLACLFALSRVRTPRLAFYGGLGLGLLLYVPGLLFFWNIFGAAAILLWLVPAVWTAIFLLLSRLCRARCTPLIAALWIPCFWTGAEYFRSELYYLRFSWLGTGFAFSHSPQLSHIAGVGVYGIGFVLMAIAAIISLLSTRFHLIALSLILLLLAVLTNIPSAAPPTPTADARRLQVAGVQLEFPKESAVLRALGQLVHDFPQVQLFMLSEYTFSHPAPPSIASWCRAHQRYLVLGVKEPAADGQFYNTACVIGPTGEIVFRQVKSVPIQFFKDGLPAPQQRLWQSPWGNIGICICYDLSYRRVTDELIRQGAQAILVPTMDVREWGQQQHQLHASIAPLRAAEYGVPIFRVCSSGISQAVGRTGRVIATAPYPGQQATISCELELGRPGSLPTDRVIAPLATAASGLFLVWLAGTSMAARFRSA